MIRVFVYGTLKPGQPNHNRIFSECKVKMTPAWTYGELYDLGWGFPAMTAGENEVYGDLLEFDDPDILQKIDSLEGYKGKDNPFNLYNRVKVNVFVNSKTPIIAWVYLMANKKLQKTTYEPVLSGIWEKK